MSDLNITTGLWVCYDCAYFIANGDLPEDDELEAAIVRGATLDSGHWCLAYEGDELPSKEWSAHPCDCCWASGDGPRVAACIVGASNE